MNQKHACGSVDWQSVAGVVLVCCAAAAMVATCLAAEPKARPGDVDKEIRELGDQILHPYLPRKKEGEPWVRRPRPQLSDEQIGRVTEYLRQRFPYRSLRDRLAYEEKLPKDRPLPTLTKTAAERLDAVDGGGKVRKQAYDLRGEALASLHSDEVRAFIARQGFGEFRRPSPSPEMLELPESKPVPFDKMLLSAEVLDGQRVPLPAAEMEFTDPDGTITDRLPGLYDAWVRRSNPLQMPTLDRLTELNRENGWRFAASSSNGHVKDVDHVAGFEAHALTTLPNPDEHTVAQRVNNLRGGKERRWLMSHLQLVSLLKHSEPGVYVSEHAPRMDDLKDARTRPLNEFESGEKLRAGEDVVVQSETNRIEMLGSIRAASQCMECHDVKRGELLGAFSYELVRREPIVPASKRGKPSL